MIVFEYQYSESHPKVRFELPPDSTLSDVVEQFEAFIRAAGYSFEGHLDTIQEEENVVS